MKGFLVTGTDTHVGKTVVCGLLAAFLRARGIDAVTQKWVQTGTPGWPADLATHRRIMGLPEDVPAGPARRPLPVPVPLPVVAHLAAEREGVEIDASRIEAAYRRLEASHDIVLVEGVGGYLVPLTKKALVCDLAARLKLSVLVVVGNRLGCVNHALLTVEAIRRREVPLAGLIFNRVPGGSRWSPEELLSDNVRIVEEISGAPVLGEVPFLENPAAGGEAFFHVGRAFLDRWKPR
jgi:dethiobiotin synthetase